MLGSRYVLVFFSCLRERADGGMFIDGRICQLSFGRSEEWYSESEVAT